MIMRVGYVPYLNMIPFHQNFGPDPMEIRERSFEFRTFSPRVLGIEAGKGVIDAGAMSLVDAITNVTQYEPIGSYGIGVKRAAGSVLLFSRTSIDQLKGTVLVTDETATSFRLLQTLLERRYKRKAITYKRIASSILYDGRASAMLLIGDEALRARTEGIKGLPVVTDLGEEWYQWQGVPFVFARWMVRRALKQEVKDSIELSLEKSLLSAENNIDMLASREARKRKMSADLVKTYWQGFHYRLTPEHHQSMALFQDMLALHV